LIRSPFHFYYRSARSLIWVGFILCFAALLWSPAASLRGAATLPERLSDEVFWRLVERASEMDGVFSSENFVSNELKYGDVIRALADSSKPGGVYLGVGPEQNFSYVAALHPRIAFIIDIRRQNLIEHLMYKALFELSSNRADFLSRLFSRKLTGLSPDVTVEDLLAACKSASPDPKAFEKNLQDIRTLLTVKHSFTLTGSDLMTLEKIYTAFFNSGPGITYRTGLAGGGDSAPTANPNYGDLMTAVDSDGGNWNFLASDAAYQSVRELEMRNLIVPVVGDFAGPKAIRVIGKYLKEYGAVVTTFYTSNVETYLFISTTTGFTPTPNGGWKRYFENLSILPLNDSSLLVRFQGAAGPGYVFSIQDDLKAVQDGRISKMADLYRKGP
jgi:hypothetical protein